MCAFRTRRYVRRRGGGRRRKFEWVYSRFDFGAAATNGQVDMLSDFRTKMTIGANLPDTTVVRIRGCMTFSIASGQVLSYTSAITAGILVLPSTIPAAQIPKPDTDPWNDWLFWQKMSPFAVSATGASAALGNDWITDMPIDSKAMRKLKNIDDTLWFSWNSLNGDTCHVHIMLAVGLKLP